MRAVLEDNGGKRGVGEEIKTEYMICCEYLMLVEQMASLARLIIEFIISNADSR